MSTFYRQYTISSPKCLPSVSTYCVGQFLYILYIVYKCIKIGLYLQDIVLKLVEARGIEPLSENLSIHLSPSAVYRFRLTAVSLHSTPANWRAVSVDSDSSAVRDAPA